MAIANEYKDKFKANSTKLDELLKSQRNDNDKRGLGYEVGESSKTAQQDQYEVGESSRTTQMNMK